MALTIHKNEVFLAYGELEVIEKYCLGYSLLGFKGYEPLAVTRKNLIDYAESMRNISLTGKADDIDPLLSCKGLFNLKELTSVDLSAVGFLGISGRVTKRVNHG